MEDQTVLILGGGINGAAIARELAINGVSVCLVDSADLASGTTAASSRLIHGGLRYLEYAEFALVKESLEERERLLRLAPHLVKPIRLGIPVSTRLSGLRQTVGKLIGGSGTKPVARGLYLVKTGLKLYDWYARDRSLPSHRIQSSDTFSETGLDTRVYRWVCTYSDAQLMYPERLVLANLLDGQTAAAANNVSFDVFTYHTAVRHDDHVEVVSELGETTKRFQPALIVNATGAWVDETLKKLKIPSDRLMGGTKGTHFITFQPALVRAVEDGGFYVEAGDGRPVFFLKFGEGVLVGTTDLRVEESPQDVLATEPELEYLVDAAQRMFPTLDFKREDIAMYYCGVRPLPHVPAGSTASITRRHFIRRHSYDGPPTMSVVGGKLTTARALGEEAAAVILNELGRQVVATSGDRPLLVGNYLDDSDHEVDSSAGSSMERFEAESGFNSAEVSAMWSLVGSSLSSYLGGPGNDSGNTDTGSAEAEKKLHKSKLLDGTPLSYEFIKGVIRREWVTKLDDLVERRLMLLYHPCLRRETIVQLSHLLVECGALHEGQVEDSVERCVERMRTRYGRRLDGS